MFLTIAALQPCMCHLFWLMFRFSTYSKHSVLNNEGCSTSFTRNNNVGESGQAASITGTASFKPETFFKM